MTLAVGAARIGIWTRDAATGQLWASAQWRELFGFTPTEQLTTENVFARLHPEDRERLRPHMEPTTHSPDVDRTEFRVLLPGGRVRWISSQGQSEVNAHGRLVRTRGASIDATARKESERELLLLRSEIAHVGRVSVMGQLATALAHEINQPLGAILRNAEAAILYLQAERPDIGELRAIVEDIRKDDQRAGAVIDRMRMLLRRQDVNMQPLVLQDLFSDVAALLRPEAMARHVKLDVAASAGLPPVAGDRVHLQQVLLNLVSNGMDSIDESSRNGRTVVVTAMRDAGRSVVIAVKDTGRGLAPDHMTQLFEPFFTTKTKGMGMGLSISRTIVEAHGGRLWAENNDEGGARFSFTVPVAGGYE
jgi:PAS domain S-box-containing protein